MKLQNGVNTATERLTITGIWTRYRGSSSI